MFEAPWSKERYKRSKIIHRRPGMAETFDSAGCKITDLPPGILRPHPHLYQIHTWAWLDELSRKAGRTVMLREVPDTEWDRVESLGFDLVYLLGLWTRSKA